MPYLLYLLKSHLSFLFAFEHVNNLQGRHYQMHATDFSIDISNESQWFVPLLCFITLTLIKFLKHVLCDKVML